MNEMSFLHNINTVSKYEARILRRSWFFRLFSIGALFIFTFMNIGLFSPIGDEDWTFVSMPSSLPLIDLYLLNIGQAIIVIFLAADFLKRDKKLDTNEVLYTRSMSNLEYVIGKTIGILRLFIGLDILILSIGLTINIISTRMSVDIVAYFAYLLIIVVPTILFSLGLAFVLMSVIKNQAITFLLLLGIAALDMFYLWYRIGSIFDYMAFGLPVFKSTIVGFDNPGLILSQRLLYFFFGSALVMATVLLFKRLPQSKTHTVFTTILLFIFVAGTAFCSYKTYSIYAGGVAMKKSVIETNRQYEDKDFATQLATSIDVAHEGESIRAEAEIVLLNDNSRPLSKYILSLNPELKVLDVTSSGKSLVFKRVNHIIEIEPITILPPGKTDTISVSYAGGINESFCYPGFSDDIKKDPYRVAMVNVNKRQAFLQDEYVLLTPETQWYPVSNLNFYPSNPARIKIDFTRYTLKVKDEEGKMAVSQGPSESTGGYRIFKPYNPLTGITLAIGNYKSDTLSVDSVKYIAYYYPGHDYYKKDLAEIRDTLPDMVSGIMRELETTFSTKYPFDNLNLVEVPVQFHSYPKENTQTRSEVQPAMVLLPEKLSMLGNSGFAKDFTRQKKRMERNNQVVTDKELKVRLFNSFIRNTFISGEDFNYVNGVVLNAPLRYRLGPSFYFFKNTFYSEEYPVINAVFESHLQNVTAQGPRTFEMGVGSISDNDWANLILRDMSFSELLMKNPVGDTIRNVLKIKGDWFFNLLRSRAGVENFNKWFAQYIDMHKFRKVDILEFNRDVEKEFGFEFYPYLGNWFYGKAQPGFLISGLKAGEIVVNDRSRYQVTFNVSNPEHVAGLFNISFRTGGPGQGREGMMGFQGGGGREGFSISMQGRGMESSDISRIVFMDSMQSKRIGVMLDFQPRAMMVNTIFSKNIPGQITMPLNDVIKMKGSTKPFEGEEVLASLPPFSDPSEIIVDNEDKGFDAGVQESNSPLKRLLGIHNRDKESYQQIRMWGTPEHWQPVVQSSYYGKYVLSAVYTRAGKGDRAISWTTPISSPGYYDVYCYIGKMVNRMLVRRGGPAGPDAPPGPEGRPERDESYKDMHYKIYHDEGVEEITVDYENTEGGWNNLGRYYLSGDTARVTLTNQSQGRIVIGDAVKWVRQQ